MNDRRRRMVIAGGLIAVLALGAAWNASRYLTLRRRATAAVDETALCEAWAKEITRRRAGNENGPPMTAEEFGELIQRTAGSAGMNPPRQNADEGPSNGNRREVNLVLSDVTMQKLLTFLHGLSDHGGVNVTSLHLSWTQNEHRCSATLHVIYRAAV